MQLHSSFQSMLKTACRLSPSIVTCLAVLVSLNATAQSWSAPVEVTDARGNGGDLGRFNSMAVVNGNPAIATVDLTHQRIAWTRAQDADGTVWNQPVSIDLPGIQGHHLSVAVVNGFPAIAYCSGIGDAADNTLMYIRANDANGDTWGTPVLVDGGIGASRFADLKVVNGKPAIAYIRVIGNYLCYYVQATDADGQAWALPTLLSSNSTTSGTNPALEIVNGNPAVVFRSITDVTYTRSFDADGVGWSTPVAIATAVNPVFFSLRVIGGAPCIAYYNDNTDRMFFHRANDVDGVAWGSGVDITGSSASVLGYRLLEVDGWPAVVYHLPAAQTLVYRRSCNALGTQWAGCGPNFVTIDAAGLFSVYPSVGIVNGNPAVAYGPDANSPYRLVFCRASTVDGLAWGTPVSMTANPKVGLHATQCIVDGYPALAYYDESNKDLRYIRANDALGQTWGTSVTIDSVGDVGSFCSMQMVNGRPAISYYDVTLNLKYVRANDALGLSWGAPVLLPSTGTSYGQGTSLAVVIDHPAVAFTNNGNGQLFYIRAGDTDGTSWPSTSNFVASVGGMPSLIDFGGVPAVAFYGGSSDLVFKLAIDPDGASWAASYTVDATGNVGQYPSLIDLAGHPAISYWDQTNVKYKYAYSFNTTGTNWSLQTVDDDVASAGFYSSLAVIDGFPAIAYRGSGSSGAFIRVKRALNNMGTNWSAPPITILTSGGVTSHVSFRTNAGDAGIAYYNQLLGYAYYIGGSQCAVGTAAPVSTTPPGNLTACYGETTTLSATGANLSWSFFSDVVGTGNAFITQPIIQNSTFVVRDSACYISAPTNIAVTVNTVDVGVTSSADTLMATATGVQYQWVDCNNGFAIIPGATDQEFTGATGVYAVVITDGACADTSACLPIINTALGAEADQPDVQVFPNPAQRTLNVRSNSSGVAELSLLDATGRMVRNTRNAQPIMNLDVSNLPRGCYALKIVSGGSSTTHRVVLE